MFPHQPVEPNTSVETLFHEHYYLIHAAVKRYRRQFRGADFDEIVSDAAYGLLQAIRRYDPSQGMMFGAYAACKIRQTMIDGFRNRWRQKGILTTAVSIDCLEPDTHPALRMTDTGYQAIENREFVGVMLNRLDERSRRLIELRFFEGLTPHVIAQQTGLEKRTVHRKIKLILKTLRRQFRQYDR